MRDKTEEPREGFEILAHLTNRYTRQAEIHAGPTTVRMGPFDELPAVALPQAQLDLTRAIHEAFHAGAAFQASVQLPQRWVISLDEQKSLHFGEVCGRTVTMVTEPDPPVDLAELEERHIREVVNTPRGRLDLSVFDLPQRVPNPYVKTFLDEALQMICPTCHQATPLPRPPTHAGPCGPACDTPAAVAP